MIHIFWREGNDIIIIGQFFADIVANHLYYLVNQNKEIDYQNHLYVKHFP